MNPIIPEIARRTVALLAPYLAEGGKATARKAGEALVALLERRLSGRLSA